MDPNLTDEERLARASKIGLKIRLLGFRSYVGKSPNQVFIRMPWWVSEKACKKSAKNIQDELRLFESSILVEQQHKLIKLSILSAGSTTESSHQ